jgi:hypothetical protein
VQAPINAWGLRSTLQYNFSESCRFDRFSGKDQVIVVDFVICLQLGVVPRLGNNREAQMRGVNLERMVTTKKMESFQ